MASWEFLIARQPGQVVLSLSPILSPSLCLSLAGSLPVTMTQLTPLGGRLFPLRDRVSLWVFSAELLHKQSFASRPTRNADLPRLLITDTAGGQGV